MNKEKEKIMKRINTYRDHLDEFKNIGLNKPAVPEPVSEISGQGFNITEVPDLSKQPSKGAVADTGPST